MNTINKYYALYIPSLIISVVTTFLVVSAFNTVDYGSFSIYNVLLGYLAITSFGFSDGIMINYRLKKIEDHSNNVFQQVIFMMLFQTVVFMICFVFVYTTSRDYLVLAALCAMLPWNLISSFKFIFQAFNHVLVIGMIELGLRILGLLIALMLVFNLLDISSFILLDIFSKVLILFIVFGYFYKIYRKNRFKKQEDFSLVDCIKNNFKVGLIVILGNWMFILMLGFDRMVLKNQSELLGEYSRAITFVTFFISILIPLRTILLARAQNEINHSKLYSSTHLMNIIGIIFASGYTMLVYPVIKYFNLFPSFISAFDLLAIIVILLPLLINVQVQLNNLIMIKMKERFMLISFFNMVLAFVIYSIGVILFGINLQVVIVCSIFVYFATYLVDLICITSISNVIKLVLPLLIWMFLYTNFSNPFIMIIYLLFVFFYAKYVFDILWFKNPFLKKANN